ncbi:MAG: hypothetical protein KGL39_35805 [Patescibacteria group bacterium]|nr:hypothetical protein [Patescibacteria group bacterium]
MSLSIVILVDIQESFRRGHPSDSKTQFVLEDKTVAGLSQEDREQIACRIGEFPGQTPGFLPYLLNREGTERLTVPEVALDGILEAVWADEERFWKTKGATVMDESPEVPPAVADGKAPEVSPNIVAERIHREDK